jgi:hypothetical protein
MFAVRQTFNDREFIRGFGNCKPPLTVNVYCWQSVRMGRTESDEKVQVVPGVEGPRWISNDDIRSMSRDGGGVGVRLRADYDDEARRYLCTSFEVFRTPDASKGKGFVTSEVLRKLAVGHLVGLTMIVPTTVLRELPNPDNVEPWGLAPPEGLSEEGPTDRVLRWVAHLYRCEMAVATNPALEVEKTLGLSHSTAGRWVRLARQNGYLGPSEGPGRAAG